MKPIRFIVLSASVISLSACVVEDRHPAAPPPAAAPAQPVGEEAIEVWDHNHPEASRELGAWVKRHPEAAHVFFEWDGAQTQRAHEFVTWTIRHPGDGIDAFASTHSNWEYFDRISTTHKPAAMEFMDWSRRFGPAAETLMSHPRGLSWAGDHLYAADWKMDHPHS
jgi:hypothetical protein